MAIYEPHVCTTYPCPMCTSGYNWAPYARPYYPPLPTVATNFIQPYADLTPGKGRHRKGDPEAGK